MRRDAPLETEASCHGTVMADCHHSIFCPLFFGGRQSLDVLFPNRPMAAGYDDLPTRG